MAVIPPAAARLSFPDAQEDGEPAHLACERACGSARRNLDPPTGDRSTMSRSGAFLRINGMKAVACRGRAPEATMPFHLHTLPRPSSSRRARGLVAGFAALSLSIANLAGAQQDFGQVPPPASTPGYPNPQANSDPSAPVNAYPPSRGQGYPPQTVPAYPTEGDTVPQTQGQPSGMAPSAYPASNMPPPSMPAQGGYSQGSNSGMPQQGAMQGNPLQQLIQTELQDYGVPPQQTLQATLHGPTPTRIPGGEVITTDRVIGLVQQNMQGQKAALVFHVLGPGPRVPGAENAAPASQAGSFNDATQQEFGRYLQQVTGGDKAKPMLFYCQNTQCWMSYNAALRAIAMGYSRVLWYRGGIEAWQQAEALAMSTQSQGQLPTQGQTQAVPTGYR
jgi:PQQ-dependent catabolism-associated CXXCW motif protein